jgi:hypothetical protein
MKMKIVYESSDGKLFVTQDACRKYESGEELSQHLSKNLPMVCGHAQIQNYLREHICDIAAMLGLIGQVPLVTGHEYPEQKSQDQWQRLDQLDAVVSDHTTQLVQLQRLTNSIRKF